MAWSVRRRWDRFHRRRPWSHNDHFHGWILRSLPLRRDNALDVGCGRGLLLERLSDRFARVSGVDVDPAMAEQACRRTADLGNVRVQCVDFAQYAAVHGDLDLITMVASFHHLEPVGTLRAVRRMLRPGGRLLVVGLCRSGGPVGLGLDVVSVVLNPLVALARQPRPGSAVVDGEPDEPPMPVREPDLTWAQLTAIVARELPGATMHRRLFFRHTLCWQAPERG